MISIDSSVFIQIVNFLVLIWALNMVLYRPIRNMLNQRREKVSGLADNINTFSQEAQDKDEAFRSGVKAARTEGLKKKAEIIQSAEEKEKGIISQLNEEAQADLAKVRDEIAKSVEEVRASLLQEVDTFANDIGEKILGRAIS